MKMYCFEYKGYGESYHIMAESSENALNYLKKYLSKLTDDEDDVRNYNYWKNSTLEKLPFNYFLIESDEGKVIVTSLQ